MRREKLKLKLNKTRNQLKKKITNNCNKVQFYEFIVYNLQITPKVEFTKKISTFFFVGIIIFFLTYETIRYS